MEVYQPATRRPIAGAFRGTAGVAVRMCVAAHIHPDAVSYASIAVSAAAGICFWQAGNHPWLLLPAPILCFVRLWLNMLDGMVAIASGKASPRGEILNDLPDRISDVLIFVGVAYSGLAAPWTGYWAAIFALLTAYVGMLGQAVGVHREFSGIMSKPWRMVVLAIGAWATLAVSLTQNPTGVKNRPVLRPAQAPRFQTGTDAPGGRLSSAAAADEDVRPQENNAGRRDETPLKSVTSLSSVQRRSQFGPFSILDWTCLFVIAGCVQTIAIRLKRIFAALDARQQDSPK